MQPCSDGHALRVLPSRVTRMTRASSVSLGLALMIAAPACSRPDAADAAPLVVTATPGAAVEPAQSIRPTDFRARIGLLAADALLGRATPSPGLEMAAAYIASEFARYGLEPAGDGESYLQRFAVPDGSAPNVVGILRGSDPVLRDTYIVFSAHIDHIGTGPPNEAGDSIFNGADDDASGTAALLELAEAFAMLPQPPARSLVFLGVSGEELGLLGSAHFVAQPAVPLDRIVANLNIDMIGRNDPGTVVAIGLRYSTLGELAEQVAAERELGIEVIDDPWPRERFFFRSDHYNFARAGVPALFFFTGPHEDYHGLEDEVERIDLDKITRVTRFIFHLGEAVAQDPAAPRWTERGRREVGVPGG